MPLLIFYLFNSCIIFAFFYFSTWWNTSGSHDFIFKNPWLTRRLLAVYSVLSSHNSRICVIKCKWVPVMWWLCRRHDNRCVICFYWHFARLISSHQPQFWLNRKLFITMHCLLFHQRPWRFHTFPSIGAPFEMHIITYSLYKMDKYVVTAPAHNERYYKVSKWDAVKPSYSLKKRPVQWRLKTRSNDSPLPQSHSSLVSFQ